MKRFFPFLCLLVLFSCGQKPEPTPEESLALSVSPTSLSFTSNDGSNKLLNLTTNGSWTATPADTWIHLNKTSGEGNASLSVTVDENDAEYNRSANILIISSKGGKELQSSVTVSQSNSSKTPIVAKPVLDDVKRASTTYQLLIYSFADSDGDGIGDFKGIQNHLDYLSDLGATALWLSPAHPTSSYHAYNVNDYFSLNPLYGTEADFKNLIDAAHSKGIKIYMDYVLNHSGTETEWFKSVKADPKNSPYRDYYVLSNGPYPKEAIGGMGGWVSLGDGNPGYKGRLHFKVDWNKKTVTVTETTDKHQDSNPSASLWLWIGKSGHFVGLYETSSKIYEITQDVDTDWGFLVTTTNDWSTATKWGGKGGENVITFGQAFALDKTTAADIVFGESTSYWASFDASMPDLNYGNPDECENSRAFQSTVESAAKWVNMGVEGFRLDAVVWVYAASASANVKFLKKWYDEVNAAYKAAGHADDIFMVGEAWHGGHGEEQQYYGGLPSNFEFDYWRNALQPAVNNGQGSGYASKVMGYISDHNSYRTAQPKAITSFFMTNHDKSSVKSKQVGDNWYSYYRAADDLGKDLAKEKQACAMLLTTPGKPFIYQGEELGYWRNDAQHDDEYIRAPIVWDASATDCAKKGVNNKVDNAMLKGSISVETQSADANSLLNTYKTWGKLRNAYPALAEGEMSTTSISGSTIASWYMTSGSQKLLVIHNVASSEKSVTLTDTFTRCIGLLGKAYLKDGILYLEGNSSVVFEL